MAFSLLLSGDQVTAAPDYILPSGDQQSGADHLALSGIQVVGVATGTNTLTPPAHQAGDALIVFAYRDGNQTPPSLPADYADVVSGGASSNSGRVGALIATGSGHTSGTWTGATSLIMVVLRAASGTLSIGASTSGAAQSTNVSYTGITLQDTAGYSRVLGFSGHRSVDTALETPPAGMENIATVVDATDEAAAHITPSGVTAWATTAAAVGGTSSGWRSFTVEVKLTPPAANPGATGSAGAAATVTGLSGARGGAAGAASASAVVAGAGGALAGATGSVSAPASSAASSGARAGSAGQAFGAGTGVAISGARAGAAGAAAGEALAEGLGGSITGGDSLGATGAASGAGAAVAIGGARAGVQGAAASGAVLDGRGGARVGATGFAVGAAGAQASAGAVSGAAGGAGGDTAVSGLVGAMAGSTGQSAGAAATGGLGWVVGAAEGRIASTATSRSRASGNAGQRVPVGGTGRRISRKAG